MLWTVERVASLLRAVQHVDDGAFKKLTEADSSTKLHKHAELAYGWKRVFELVVLDDPTFTELTPQKCSDKVRKLSSNSHLRKEAASHRQKREEENKQLLMDYEKSQRDFLKEQKKTGGGKNSKQSTEISGDDLPKTHPGHNDFPGTSSTIEYNPKFDLIPSRSVVGFTAPPSFTVPPSSGCTGDIVSKALNSVNLYPDFEVEVAEQPLPQSSMAHSEVSSGPPAHATPPTTQSKKVVAPPGGNQGGGSTAGVSTDSNVVQTPKKRLDQIRLDGSIAYFDQHSEEQKIRQSAILSRIQSDEDRKELEHLKNMEILEIKLSSEREQTALKKKKKF